MFKPVPVSDSLQAGVRIHVVDRIEDLRDWEREFASSPPPESTGPSTHLVTGRTRLLVHSTGVWRPVTATVSSEPDSTDGPTLSLSSPSSCTDPLSSPLQSGDLGGPLVPSSSRPRPHPTRPRLLPNSRFDPCPVRPGRTPRQGGNREKNAERRPAFT